MSRTLRTIAWAVAAATLAGVVPLLAGGTASAASSVTFTCVKKDANNCVVTIKLRPHMNERVASTMPDAHMWFQHLKGGNGKYKISPAGSPQTYWNGVSGGTHGTSWSALLTTSAVTRGTYAAITFTHEPKPAKRYAVIRVSYPEKVDTNTIALITSKVQPVPAKGHLLLQRQSPSGWKKDVAFTYSTSTKEWSARLPWPFGKGASRSFRVLATKAPGLLATASSPFKISTHD